MVFFSRKCHKQKQGLMEAIFALGDGLIPGKVTGTRWLPHLWRGISGFLRTFPAYHAHLCTASHTNPKAEGLVNIMLQKDVMALILLLQVSLLYNFFLQFLENNITDYSVISELSYTN